MPVEGEELKAPMPKPKLIGCGSRAADWSEERVEVEVAGETLVSKPNQLTV